MKKTTYIYVLTALFVALFVAPIVAVLLSTPSFAAPQKAFADPPIRPRLVVNIVVSGLTYNGLQDLTLKGTTFNSARYNFMQTVSPATLATFATGENPSMHGVISSAWVDRATGKRVALIRDAAVQGLGNEPDSDNFSPHNLIVPTLGDRLSEVSPASKIVSIAAAPMPAIVLGGWSGKAFWLCEGHSMWSSSTGYMRSLPAWVTEYNRVHQAKISSSVSGRNVEGKELITNKLCNSLVADFAFQTVKNEALGADDTPDILNVYFDALSTTSTTSSATAAGMDIKILEGLVRAIENEIGAANSLIIITSDHGAGPKNVVGRFNVNRFKTLLGTFLAAQFGAGDWVVDYIDRQVYLNHKLVYVNKLSLEEVQNRAASLALQFSGVSHVLTATAMSSGYFGADYGAMMQRGFYPRRAGDIMLNLAPNWLEDNALGGTRSGSMYDYDTHVPLIFYGWKVPEQVISTPVDMTCVAPVLARILGVGFGEKTLPEIDF